jgi:hypothetical protein
MENCLKYLRPQDLVSPSLACRAWHPAATGLMHRHFNLFEQDQEAVGRMICGLQLHSLVFGEGGCNIKRLDLYVVEFESEYITLIARLVAPTLSSMTIEFDDSKITSSIKNGFSRLKQLDLVWCRGNVSMFKNHGPIAKLQSLKY